MYRRSGESSHASREELCSQHRASDLCKKKENHLFNHQASIITRRERNILIYGLGGIAPNQVIARSEFEVHRQIYTE